MCIAALQLVNLVRSAQFNEDMVYGSLYLLAQRIEQDPSSIADWATRFDLSLAIKDIDSLDLGPYQKARLADQRPLLDTTNKGRTVQLLYQLNQNNILEVNLNTVTELQAQATAYLLLEDWQRSGEPLDVFLQKLQPHFGFPLAIVNMSDLELSQSDITRLQYGGEVLVRMTIAGKEAEAIIKIPSEERVIRLGPIRAFNPYSWEIIVTISLIALTLFALGVYWVVNSFEVRLRNLEQATSRLAMGHLNARVALKGGDPVSRLGVAFNKMAEHIQRLISIQREMIRAVSHELRTPVARIRFGLQIIEDSSDNAFVLQQVSDLDGDIEELDELIDEILTYARLEEGGPLLEFQPTNVAAIVKQVVDESRPPEHVSVVYVGEPVNNSLQAEVESRYIHRAVQNLVGNAGRYAVSKVRVTCSISNNTCRVDVEDDGPGIPEEQWEKVFIAFARLDDSRTRSSGGYGLGLSIVRRIAYWHGGRAMVSKSDGLGGARFSLIWPRKQNSLE